MNDEIINPGTVSRILWHFTGGPSWDLKKQRQNIRPKYPQKAYESLLSILKTSELRVGSYKEIVRVVTPVVKSFDPTLKKTVIKKNVLEELSSNPVCCLADVPVMHLSYLSQRYGKFAIGFHRDAVLNNGFNPVFYTLDNRKIIRTFYEGLSELNNIDASMISYNVESIKNDISTLLLDNEIDDDFDEYELNEINDDVDSIEWDLSSAERKIKEILSFIKTFDKSEFSTIYCEREWRAVKTFNFRHEDVAMIVVPKGDQKKQYFDDFINNEIKSIKLPRKIPIVPWEDLVEH